MSSAGRPPTAPRARRRIRRWPPPWPGCCNTKPPACAMAMPVRCRPGKSPARLPGSGAAYPGPAAIRLPCQCPGRRRRRRRRDGRIALVGPGHGRRATDPVGPGRPASSFARDRRPPGPSRGLYGHVGRTLEEGQGEHRPLRLPARGPGPDRAHGGDPGLSAGPGLAGPVVFVPRARTRTTT